MMNGKQKLYFFLNAIDDARVLAPSGQPFKIHATHDLKKNYRETELDQLFTKLEKDEQVIKVLKIGDRRKEIENMYALGEPDDGCWHIELLPAFDNYFLKIQNEPEYQEFMGRKVTPLKAAGIHDLSLLHPIIFSKCQSLFEKTEYPETVEKGFKVVRDRLRKLTGYETGSEAFGKGKLHIKGAAAQNVDLDFNEGVKFLTMAIDKFRNEKSHTSDAKIDDPKRAYEYLTLNSLAMNLLDQAEILK
ncbi:TIGR02391 family protein [Patescibacteria group bacterium]|nr:TIGR02391 family protein [Patescibacteria group bacterium]MBU4016494.1 TIGR02391 family protein [Patescibacteria group bacterium]MBU4099569.1 TIGR02391 family protein [Patescibacteria group bacterium]